MHQGTLLWCYRCIDVLTLEEIERGEIEREHFLERALGGADEPSNCVYSHKACHAIVTNGTKATTAGSSKHRIAKCKRIANPKQKPKRKWPSRSFQKRAKP